MKNTNLNDHLADAFISILIINEEEKEINELNNESENKCLLINI